MFSQTALVIAGGTCISLIVIFALWCISLMGLSFAGVSFHALTKNLLLGIHFLLIIIFDILIITKVIKISPALIALGYIILTVVVWVMVCVVYTLWSSTYQTRTKFLYNRITQNNELIVEYRGSINQLCGYYHKGKKVYLVEKLNDRPYYLVNKYSKIKDIDTSLYSKLYEKKDKFTLFIKEEVDRDGDIYYHSPIMHLHDVGLFVFPGIDYLDFDSLDLIVLNEEIHAKFKERAEKVHLMKLLSDCKSEVSEINRQTLYKKQRIWGPVNEKDNFTIVDYKNVVEGVIIYYDSDGKIRKMIETFNYPDNLGFEIFYFDADGYAVNYMEQNGGEISFNAIRYPHTDSIPKHLTDDPLLKFDAKTARSVTFCVPKLNDRTVTNIHRVNLYKNNYTSDSEIIAVVELGSIVQILEPENYWWYKVNINGLTGYIRDEFLELVECIAE